MSSLPRHAPLCHRPRPTGLGAQPFLLRSAASFVTRILSVFGLASAPGDFLGFADAPSSAAASGGDMEVVLDAFTAFRWAGGGGCLGGDGVPVPENWAGINAVLLLCHHRSSRSPLLLVNLSPARAAWLSPLCRDQVRGLAKGKTVSAELLDVCSGIPDAATVKAGSSGRAAEMLAAFAAFRAEVAALALASGFRAQNMMQACDR